MATCLPGLVHKVETPFCLCLDDLGLQFTKGSRAEMVEENWIGAAGKKKPAKKAG